MSQDCKKSIASSVERLARNAGRENRHARISNGSPGPMKHVLRYNQCVYVNIGSYSWQAAEQIVCEWTTKDMSYPNPNPIEAWWPLRKGTILHMTMHITSFGYKQCKIPPPHDSPTNVHVHASNAWFASFIVAEWFPRTFPAFRYVSFSLCSHVSLFLESFNSFRGSSEWLRQWWKRCSNCRCCMLYS